MKIELWPPTLEINLIDLAWVVAACFLGMIILRAQGCEEHKDMLTHKIEVLTIEKESK